MAGAKDPIKMTDNHGWTPLHFAVRYANPAMVQALLNKGAKNSINQPLNNGWTPLHIAARHGTHEMVQELLKAGTTTSINQPNNDGITPLHLAARYGSIQTIRCLLVQTDQTPKQMLAVYRRSKLNPELESEDIESLHPYTLQGRMLLAGMTTVQIITAIGAIATSITFLALSAPLLPILAPIIGGFVIFRLASIAKSSIQQNSIKPEYRTQPANEKKRHSDSQGTRIENKHQNYSQGTSVESTDSPPFPNSSNLNNESGKKTHPAGDKATQITSGDFYQAPEAEWTLVQTSTQIGVNSGRSNEGNTPIATEIAICATTKL